MKKVLLKLFWQNSLSYADGVVIAMAAGMGGWHGAVFVVAGLLLSAIIGCTVKGWR